MTNKELATLLSAKVFNEGEEKEIQSWYVGDLLSFVMGTLHKAQDGLPL